MRITTGAGNLGENCVAKKGVELKEFIRSLSGPQFRYSSLIVAGPRKEHPHRPP